MRRREFIALIGGAAMSAPAIGVRAQGAKTIRLGYLSPAGPPDVNLESFRAGMRDIGYGRLIARDGPYARMWGRAMAAE